MIEGLFLAQCLKNFGNRGGQQRVIFQNQCGFIPIKYCFPGLSMAKEAGNLDIPHGPFPLQRPFVEFRPIDIINGDRHEKTLRTYGHEELGDRLRVYWRGAEYRGRGRNTHWQGRVNFTGAKIVSMKPVNHWNHERQLECDSDSSLVFDAVTSGNFAGADLALSGGSGSTVDVETNLVSGKVAIREIGLEDHVLDAGGAARL